MTTIYIENKKKRRKRRETGHHPTSHFTHTFTTLLSLTNEKQKQSQNNLIVTLLAQIEYYLRI